MSIHPLAGTLAPAAKLANIPRLISAYYTQDAAAPVAFGTSGHRGSSLLQSFNEAHILAISEAICRYRTAQGTTGPLFIGMDTHALSEPAFQSALEVLAANGVEVMIDDAGGYTPTPAISLAILNYNRGRTSALADGIVITPSHNPPEDGGFKYNPPHGGPADSDATKWIEKQANAFIAGGLQEVKRISIKQALAAPTTHRHDYVTEYVDALDAVIDFDVIRSANPNLGVAPLGGAGVAYWPRIAERYKLNLTVVDDSIDPTFRFMTLDWDGKIRMDCSSPYAMASLIAMKDRFDVAFACDTDHDRHGIVTRSAGLMNPNHYLAVAIEYLFSCRGGWSAESGVGKTMVSSSMIDRVANGLGRKLVEVPVGFKFFVDGLLTGSLGFGGEESAGASFLKKDGTVWSTDKDGLILGLLSAEILSRTGNDPAQMYASLTSRYGSPVYERIDAAATPEQKSKLAKLSASEVTATELAGETIEKVLTAAPSNGAALGGLKVMTANGWFAARPSGTENVYKIYAESFLGKEHLRRVQEEAKALVATVL